jgi:hypothetical protein
MRNREKYMATCKTKLRQDGETPNPCIRCLNGYMAAYHPKSGRRIYKGEDVGVWYPCIFPNPDPDLGAPKIGGVTFYPCLRCSQNSGVCLDSGGMF